MAMVSCGSSDYNYLASPDDIYLSTIRLFVDLKPRYCKGGASSQRRGEKKFFPLVKSVKKYLDMTHKLMIEFHSSI
jgi:hypothetical protein